MKIFALMVAVLLTGCQTKVVPTAPTPVPTGISQSEVTEIGLLDFSVTLTIPLSKNRTLHVTSQSRPWLSSEDKLSFVDEIKQTEDGKWVIFDCDNPADRIIYADLVNEVKSLCVSLHGRAEDFWRKCQYAPDEFTDSTGARWRKEK